MDEVTRYDLTEDVNTGVVDITPVPNSMEGRYVTFEDYAEEKHRADQNAAYLETLTERMLAAEKENAALQQKLDAVLAENVALKDGADKCYDEITSIHNSYGWSVSEDGESETAVIDLESALFVLNENIIDIKTPATDAIVNEVRAEGVGMFASAIQGGCAVGDRVKDLADNFAAQLRAGSTEGGV